LNSIDVAELEMGKINTISKRGSHKILGMGKETTAKFTKLAVE
jgi:hypothetical protein